MNVENSHFKEYYGTSARWTLGRRIFSTMGFMLCWALFLFTETKAELSQPESAGSEITAGTIISSDSLVMRSQRKMNHFRFQGKVRVESTNLTLESDQLEIVSLREENLNQTDVTIGEFGGIQRIIAKGHVIILQTGRRAEAGLAEIFPIEGKVILKDSPRVMDGQGEVRGWRITLFKDEKRALVEVDPNNGENRPTVRLNKLPDLGFQSESEARN